MLFDGNHSSEEIDAGLPKKPREMFSPEFLAEFDAGRPTWLLTALAANEAFQWTPQAPVRLYYGERTTMSPPGMGTIAHAELARRGANVSLISVGPFERDQTILHAGAPKVRAWFDELSAP